MFAGGLGLKMELEWTEVRHLRPRRLRKPDQKVPEARHENRQRPG